MYTRTGTDRLDQSGRVRGFTAVVSFLGPEYGHRCGPKKVKPDSRASNFWSHFWGQKAGPKLGPFFKAMATLEKEPTRETKKSQQRPRHLNNICTPRPGKSKSLETVRSSQMDKPTGVRPEAICPPTHRSPIQDPCWNCTQTTSIPQAAFCSYYGVKPNDKPDLRARYRTPPREMWFKDPLKQTTANPEHVTPTNGKSYAKRASRKTNAPLPRCTELHRDM